MTACFKRATALLVAACILALGVASASANHFRLSETRFTIAYAPLRLIASATGTTVSCNLTLTGSFHAATLEKVRGTLVGYITNAQFSRPCTGGEMWANTAAEGRTETLPWHRQYASFTGTLPSIGTITFNLIRSSIEVRSTFFGIPITCRYTPATVGEINTVGAGGVITGNRAEEVSTSSETGGCPAIRYSGTGAVRSSGGSSITVTLI